MTANTEPVQPNEPEVDVESDAVEAEPEAATAATESEPDEQTELPLDQVFEILKNERRRTVLRYLESHDAEVSLGDLAEHVAADENDTTVQQVTSRERKCAYVGLYQCHLPKMDSMDIIEFNQNRGRVKLGPAAPQVEQYMEWSDATPRSWPHYYAAVSGASVALVGVTMLAAGPGLVPLVVSTVSLLAIAVLSVGHIRAERESGDRR